MKDVVLKIPDGYEMRREGNSYTLVEKDPKFSEYLEEINRPWYLDDFGSVIWKHGSQSKNQVPTEELAEGQLVLAQLLSFRHDIWEKEGKPSEKSYTLWFHKSTIKVLYLEDCCNLFRFKTEESAKYFLKKHQDLLNIYRSKVINV